MWIEKDKSNVFCCLFVVVVVVWGGGFCCCCDEIVYWEVEFGSSRIGEVKFMVLLVKDGSWEVGKWGEVGGWFGKCYCEF